MNEQTSRLKNFPISWFAVVMGLSGFSIAWNRAEYVFDPGFCVSSVLLGIAGRERSLIHAQETGRVLTAIDPEYVGALSLMLIPGTPLHEDYEAGRFVLIDPDETLQELRIMIEATHLTRGLFHANHASNYLPIRAKLPAEKNATLALIDQALEGKIAALEGGQAALAVASLSSKVTRPALTRGTVNFESSKAVSKLSAVSLVTEPSCSTGAPLEKDGDEIIDWSIWDPAVAKSWILTLSRLTTSSRPCGSL